MVAALACCLGVAACSESGAPDVSSVGEDTYNRFCFSCHASGVAGAPRTGDVEAWAPRIAKGRELLLQSVKNGIPPGMPPMGLCTGCSDDEISAATEYMISRSR
jgi:cytochrome c5